MALGPTRVATRRSALGLSLLLVLSALALPALADDGPKTYTAVVAPAGGPEAQVCAGLSTTFTLTLANTSSQQQLGSANITPGFKVSGVTIDRAGSSNISGDTIELRGLSLPAGESLAVTFTGSPVAGNYTFDIVAKQANNFRGSPGNNLTLSGDPASVTVTNCNLSLAFVEQPGDSVVGQPISGPPSVRILANGKAVAVSGLDITVTIDSGTLAGTTKRGTDATGLATFDDLSVSPVGAGYVLTAAAGGLAPVDSDPFDVLYDIATCASGDLCEATAEPIEGFTLLASGTAVGGVGRLSIGAGDPRTDGPLPGCQPPAGVTISSLPAGILLDGQGLTNKQAVFAIDENLRKEETNNGVSAYQICVEPVGSIPDDTRSFVDRYTGNVVVGQHEFDALVEKGDNTDGFQVRGFLPDCRPGRNGVPAPCVADRSGADDGGATITMDFGSRFKTF
jgi:hypothetical protein